MTLTELRPEKWAKILKINLPWEEKKHLIELGIIANAKIKLISKNPFGQVLLLQVEDTHVALSEKLARELKIELIN